jgi:hypothetical protein
MTTTFGTAPKANDGIASPRADAPNKPPKLRRDIEVMETSPIDFSSAILSDGVAKEHTRTLNDADHLHREKHLSYQNTTNILYMLYLTL